MGSGGPGGLGNNQRPPFFSLSLLAGKPNLTASFTSVERVDVALMLLAAAL